MKIRYTSVEPGEFDEVNFTSRSAEVSNGVDILMGDDSHGPFLYIWKGSVDGELILQFSLQGEPQYDEVAITPINSLVFKVRLRKMEDG